ncbi:hypothetical protein BVC80_695g28 [Macleaya cordata]|uniref:Uncharacterized protein n=1 Tax=Macleaya cordata TaxID=56857 RepID=A0A200Q0M5_MACCD|nr:hypothetical protein BVC80_695g28 [Macleaya cordata]
MFSTSLHTFESDISKSLFHLFSLDSKNSESNFTTTLPWIQKCIQILPTINKAFKKLVLDIDYPITTWELASIDEYLNYSLNSLESLNSITSSLTQLRQARMIVSHALSLVEEEASSLLVSEHLKPIQPQLWTSSSNKNSYGNQELEGEMKFCSEKEWIIHQALIIKKSVWYWLCRVVESSIRGDVQLEMKKELSPFSSPLVSLQLSSVCEQMRGRKGVLKEVTDVNEAVVRLTATAADERSEQIGDAVNELKGRVDVLGKMLEGVEEDVNRLFSGVLLGRNEVLDSFQQRKD